MIRIKCGNPQCTSPTKGFQWDETQHISAGGKIAQPDEQGAKRVIAVCPFCLTENTVWVSSAKSSDVLTRKAKTK